MFFNKILFISCALLAGLSASEYQASLSIIKRHATHQTLSVTQARELVNALWSGSFCSAHAASPVQKLTHGFDFLLEQLSHSREQSLAEQAYLMWCTGRTHGFSDQGTTADTTAIQKTRGTVARSVALGMMERKDKLSSTEQCIQNMLGETVQPPVRHADDEMVLSVRVALCDEWAQGVGLNLSPFSVVRAQLSARTIPGIWEAYLQDISPLFSENMLRTIEESPRRVNEMQLQITREQTILADLESQRRELATELARLAEKKQSLESAINSLSPQRDRLRTELEQFEDAKLASMKNSCNHGAQTDDPVKVTPTRSLLSAYLSPSVTGWGGVNHALHIPSDWQSPSCRVPQDTQTDGVDPSPQKNDLPPPKKPGEK